jgi:proteasome lid subunit RPN8/RPN11
MSTPLCAEEILQHAKECFPKECCGLIVAKRGKPVYWRCRNLAQKQSQFIMDPADFAAAEDAGDVIAVVHSHCNESANPSDADKVACEASGLPWHIVSIPTEQWGYIEPTGFKAPLVGRVFSHGVLDCYSLVVDWYNQELGIELMDFDRDESWWTKGRNMYMENFEKAGFVQLSDDEPLQRGDGILMQIDADVANHAAIYLGDDIILQHLMNRLSGTTVYGGFWRKHTRCVVRYAGKK